MTKTVSYKDVGVDLEAAESLTSRIAELVESTRTEGVRAGFGSFGGRYVLPGGDELVASADGVGTKVLVAAAAGRHDTIGEDLVNHCANDVLADGGLPLFFLDYFATGELDPEVGHAVIAGVARGCRNNGCALLGGETAEMPGVYRAGEYDLAGFMVARREFDIPSREALQAGDICIGLAASGFHTNGYSLLRGLLFERLDLCASDPFPGLERSIADVLLEVHRPYLAHIRESCAAGLVQSIAHITGGGLPGNMRRVLPPDLDARVDLSSWSPGPEFRFVAEETGLSPDELCTTLNMGIGMVLIVRSAAAAEVLSAVDATGCAAFLCGELTPGSGDVRLEGAW